VYFLFLRSPAPVRVGPSGFAGTGGRTGVEAGGGIGGGEGSLGIGLGRMRFNRLLH
jgi:hypothetical protein